MNIFELVFVDKNRNEVTTEEWLHGKEGTWELKYPFLAGLIFCIILALCILFGLLFLSIFSIVVGIGLLIACPFFIVITIYAGISSIFRKIKGICFHKKSLLGLLETVSGREQWYCSKCNKIIYKKGKKR